MEVPESQALNVLRDSIIDCLEGGQKGSKFPTLHAYLEMDGEDIDNLTVRKLRDEFAQIIPAMPALRTGLYQNGKFMPVEYISGRIRMSNPDAGLILTSVGLPKDFPAREKLEELVNQSINICDEALRRNCGFGKYTTC